MLEVNIYSLLIAVATDLCFLASLTFPIGLRLFCETVYKSILPPKPILADFER